MGLFKDGGDGDDLVPSSQLLLPFHPLLTLLWARPALLAIHVDVVMCLSSVKQLHRLVDMGEH